MVRAGRAAREPDLRTLPDSWPRVRMDVVPSYHERHRLHGRTPGLVKYLQKGNTYLFLKDRQVHESGCNFSYARHVICVSGTGLVLTSPGESGARAKVQMHKIHESTSPVANLYGKTWGISTKSAGLAPGLVNESGSPQVRGAEARQAPGRSPGWRRLAGAPCSFSDMFRKGLATDEKQKAK